MKSRRLGGSAVLLSHHVDALELSCEVMQVGLLLPADGRDELDRRLGELQDLGRAQRPEAAVQSPWEWGGDRERVIVHPSGMRPGARYALECSDWMAFVQSPRAVAPRIMVQCRAAYLLRRRPVEVFDEVVEWVTADLLPLIGGRPDEDEPIWRIARLDLAADVLGVSLSASRLRHFTSRANSRTTHHASEKA